MNIDKYLDRVYDESKYNCASFACEVWKDLKNDDISDALGGCMAGPGHRKLGKDGLKRFVPLAVPKSPCLALFQIGRKVPHVGIWLDGRILHISKNGVEWNWLELVMIGFNKVRFYDVKNCNC